MKIVEEYIRKPHLLCNIKAQPMHGNVKVSCNSCHIKHTKYLHPPRRKFYLLSLAGNPGCLMGYDERVKISLHIFYNSGSKKSDTLTWHPSCSSRAFLTSLIIICGSFVVWWWLCIGIPRAPSPTPCSSRWCPGHHQQNNGVRQYWPPS